MTMYDETRSDDRELLRRMLLIRRFEERCAQLYQQSEIHGFLHLYIGEEAVAVGVMDALRPDDAVVATYREHGHALMKGVPAGAVMAEMFGRVDGCSGGRGGSMHLFDAEHRFYGGNAIVAGGLPLAVGLALADVELGRDRVTACFFGEGAAAEGEFHEAMNLAALWSLPVVFCCENNLYAMGTSLARSQADIDLTARAETYGMAAEAIDGMDVEAVAGAARSAIDGVRSDGGPRFLELRTYRFRAHSMYDPELYREKEEVSEWRDRDPIQLLVQRMRADSRLDEAALERLEHAVQAEIDAAVEFGMRSPIEPVDQLLRHVLAEEAAS
ncbi:pyruvate dehydrogenase (acetyl-transferring) E1 component subunit alpha [Ilumatobacter sp.]|uniref:pyruvate dehydrogenase (acetyl-transferring) E1 component subunit alpha n=1 Tax=Ilumatobacter sp. TaxID=1967498 RepID=UPI003AF9463E